VKEGFRFDLGGHRWFAKNDEVNNFVIELMGSELIDVDRVSRIYFDNRFFDYPIKISNVLKNAGALFSARALASFLLAHVKSLGSQKPPLSMEDAYVRQFGRLLFETFFSRYSEKVWGRGCNELSADWVAQRTKGLSIFTTLRNALVKPKQTVESLVENFKYPRLGYYRISERMADVIRAGGGTITLDKLVSQVAHDGQRITSVRMAGSDPAQTSMAADEFISSIPVNLLVRMLTPAAPKEVLEAAAKLQFRALITVNLMLAKEQVTPDNWLYIHDPKIKFARIHEPKNWSPAMAPAGKTSLVAEYFCTVGDGIWNMTDAELCDLTIGDLTDKLRFITRSEVIGAFALREKNAYPVYTIGYDRYLTIIKNYLKGFSNLQIAGRGGTFRYNNSDHSIEAGFLAAQNVLGSHFDLDQVNSQPEYLEEKRVPVKLESFVDTVDRS
jgi:protoporphyrinogen oxidase